MIINVVLVRTIYPSNIGSVARVIGNMAANRLILVNPQCEIDSKARSSAAGAQKWLLDKTVYPTLDDFFKTEGEGLRIALTRRSGKQRSTRPIVDVIKLLKKRKLKPANIYLFFGPEDNGLDASELELMNYCCSLPVPGEFKSMNLSHSVLLTLHLVLGIAKPSTNNHSQFALTPAYFPEDTVKEWINAMGFDWKKRRSSALGTIKKVLLSSTASSKQIKNIEAILQQSIRKMKSSNKN
jgi:tRNA/rRNA methyltransferase